METTHRRREYAEEPRRAVPVMEHFDVAVIGGGIAGVAAAIAAKRRGASVCLVERGVSLGGLATTGNVVIYLPLCDGNGSQVIGGIAEELMLLADAGTVRESADIRVSRIPECWAAGADGTDARAAQRYQMGFNPAVVALQLEKLLVDSGVDVLYDARFSAAPRTGRRIDYAILDTKSGRIAVAARVFVDATGDADVCAAAGEKTVDLATNVRSGWFYYLRNGRICLHCLSDPFPEDGSPPAGDTPSYSGANYRSVARQVLASHQLVREQLEKLRLRSPEETIEPIRLPEMPSFRMTRRLDGEATLRGADRGRWFDDAVGVAASWRRSGEVYSIPFGALTGPATDNLLAAGRCISAADKAWDMARAIPVCALTGEIAGTAAAMRRDGAVIDPAELRAELLRAGNIISPDRLAGNGAVRR